MGQARVILIAAVVATLSCAPQQWPANSPDAYRFEVRGAGGFKAVVVGLEITRDKQYAKVVDGRLTANGRNYGPVSYGSTIVLEEDSRVFVNGEERQPE